MSLCSRIAPSQEHLLWEHPRQGEAGVRHGLVAQGPQRIAEVMQQVHAAPLLACKTSMSSTMNVLSCGKSRSVLVLPYLRERHQQEAARRAIGVWQRTFMPLALAWPTSHSIMPTARGYRLPGTTMTAVSLARHDGNSAAGAENPCRKRSAPPSTCVRATASVKYGRSLLPRDVRCKQHLLIGIWLISTQLSLWQQSKLSMTKYESDAHLRRNF